MGLILDTSILIAGERRGGSMKQVLTRLRDLHGDTETAISAVTVVELTHGIYRARTEQDRIRRSMFAEEVFEDLYVYPLTLEIARRAGQIEGEEAAKGNAIAFEDLVIGATALGLGFEVVTLNVRHFERIPGLTVLTL